MSETDAEVKVTLALLSSMARAGASDGEIARKLAYMGGAKMIVLEELGGGRVDVKADRVHSVGPDYRGGTVLTFNGIPDHHPKSRLVVIDEINDVVRKLHEQGWEG